MENVIEDVKELVISQSKIKILKENNGKECLRMDIYPIEGHFAKIHNLDKTTVKNDQIIDANKASLSETAKSHGESELVVREKRESWLTDGNCKECRRESYCKKECKKHKRRNRKRG